MFKKWQRNYDKEHQTLDMTEVQCWHSWQGPS